MENERLYPKLTEEQKESALREFERTRGGLQINGPEGKSIGQTLCDNLNKNLSDPDFEVPY